jgi:hypothetical protein
MTEEDDSDEEDWGDGVEMMDHEDDAELRAMSTNKMTRKRSRGRGGALFRREPLPELSHHQLIIQKQTSST